MQYALKVLNVLEDDNHFIRSKRMDYEDDGTPLS